MISARVITVSDRCAAGVAEDRSGPTVVEALIAAGYDASVEVIPDGEGSVAGALRRALAAGARLIVTTGGTGVGPRDRTPEGTGQVVDRTVPGVAELIRATGVRSSPHAALTRGIAGVVDSSDDRPGALIVNLPGSVRAATEGAGVVVSVAAHILDQLQGGDH
jgi:molybdenum cofactor synthesis domain-containing protein